MPSCPSCQGYVPAGKRFCADCGAALHITSAPTETTHGRIHPHVPRHRVDATRPGAAIAGRQTEARFIPGATVAGRYRVVGLLGRGGMGEVYRADDLKLGQPVALKFLPSGLQPGDARFNRLLGEVRLARQVSHPNVCRVYDAGEVDGQHFLSMEYIDGEDLASLLRRIGRLPQDKAVQLARQLCAGLNAAHEQGILHRDLKPANVMIDGRGRAKITDFGLAALSEDLGGEDPSAGTPAYMAPEQLAGNEVTEKSDLYALGLVLYELFTGRMAFSGGSVDEIVRQRREVNYSSPSDHVEGFDPDIEGVIQRCLETNPADRPRSALAVSAAMPGGDPLAAALAAGETPSPEMVAAAGETEALSPGRALLLALLAIGFFVTGVSLNGRDTLRAYLPMEKSPVVMIDRARAVIAELGYTESVYAEPFDTAIGYSILDWPLDDIRKNDRSPDRWERLRDPEAGVLRFWYRQSPRPFAPQWGFGGPGEQGRVELSNPFPRTTGEIIVTLTPDGRLASFLAVPRRYSEPVATAPEYDWSLSFRLAGLDIAGFEPSEPRYQHYMQHDRRAAWTSRNPETRYRIEAGVNEGRLSLFTLLDRDEAKELTAEPRDFVRGIPDIFTLFMLAISLAGAIVARANLRRGRADRRAAQRLGLVMGSASFMADLLAAHGLFSGMTGLRGFGFSLISGIAWGVLSMLIYLALEPFARATWPSLLASWTRLTGRDRPRGRDPSLGRAILGGLVAGAAVSLLRHPVSLLAGLWDGVPVQPHTSSWAVLVSQKEAWGGIVTALSWSLDSALVIVFLLVIARRIVRRKVPAAIGAFVVQSVPIVLSGMAVIGEYSMAEVVSGWLVFAVGYVVLIVVVLNWGLVGAVAAGFVWNLLGWFGTTSDWGAWHAQPAILSTIVVGGLALYAYWAATPAARRAR